MKLQGTILKECGILLPLLVQFSTAIALNKAISPQPYNTMDNSIDAITMPKPTVSPCEQA
jgi:hypothetical protein